MDMELNTEALEAIEAYYNIMKHWDMKRCIYPYTEEDFVTFLEGIKNKEALFMFFKLHDKEIRKEEELVRVMGNRQITNRYLRLMIMEFKLSNYFD